jgi:hypothetical protein
MAYSNLRFGARVDEPTHRLLSRQFVPEIVEVLPVFSARNAVLGDCRVGRSPRGKGFGFSASLQSRVREAPLVRADGIEPTRPAWKAGVLPLNYARVAQAGDSPLRLHGQACNIDLPSPQRGSVICFSPGFYPLSRCERSICAVVCFPWQSSLRPLRLLSSQFAQWPKKSPRT